jgi:hypothetical protein
MDSPLTAWTVEDSTSKVAGEEIRIVIPASKFTLFNQVALRKSVENRAYHLNYSPQFVKMSEFRSLQSRDGFTSQRWVKVCFVLLTSLLHNIFNYFTYIYIVINLPYEIHCYNIMSRCVLHYLSHFDVFLVILYVLCLFVNCSVY